MARALNIVPSILHARGKALGSLRICAWMSELSLVDNGSYADSKKKQYICIYFQKLLYLLLMKQANHAPQCNPSKQYKANIYKKYWTFAKYSPCMVSLFGQFIYH